MASPTDGAAPAVPAPLRGRIPQVDGLRGLAVLLVVVWHYFIISLAGTPLGRVLAPLRVTWSGVDLFFVLSGFLIGGILVDSRESPRYFGTFYARRFFRIVPLYAVVCVAYGLGAVAGGAHWGGTSGPWMYEDPPPWWAYALFIPNVFVGLRGTFKPLSMGVMWSLGVEEQFYATLPIVVRRVTPARLAALLGAFVVLVPVGRTVAYHALPHGGLFDYAMMPCRADSLLLGVLAALLVRSPRGWAYLLAHRGPLKVLAAAAGLAMLAVGMRTPMEGKAMATFGYSGLALFYTSVLLLALSSPSGWLGTALTHRALRWMGDIAYGTYLLHVLVLGVFFGVLRRVAPQLENAQDVAVTLLALVATIVLARVSFVYFEKPLVGRGHRFQY